jgi:phage tail sheath protein
MFGNYAGRARVETDIADISVLVSTGLKGITAVLGKTERGSTDKPVLVGSWNEFVTHFGGELSDTEFPTYCRRALDGGAKLLVGRVAHYGTISDKQTLSGVTAKVAQPFPIEATSVGAWGNKVKISIKKAANGVENQYDLTTSLEGNSNMSVTIKNINATLTLDDINRFNAGNTLVFIKDTYVGQKITEEKELQLAGGSEDRTQIVKEDYIGDPISNTGIHMFDNYGEFTKICIPELAIPEVDIALVSYVDKRKDCIALLRTPIGISGLKALDYRNGKGSYSHTPINSWRAFMFFGGIQITDANGGTKTISAIGDVIGAIARKDNANYEWFTFAGAKRGLISNAIGIEYNLASPARATEFDQIDLGGINAVVADKDYGLVIWGNNTLQRTDTLLKHANIAELMTFISRSLAPLIRSELFEPNDIATWKTIYRRVRPFMQTIKDKRGIWDFKYEGDQDVDSIDEAIINTSQSVDNGEYHFILWVKPKTALKYIGIKVVVTNSGVNFEVAREQVTI